ncbi:entericidin A/B family lipoprotein [Sphingomonas aliaeris]|uniref:Entericidin A/B family lipoprotein n=1 Tax=Sphingomonas aliaeris TaxID=2759526 RepID=A0A974S3D5_9SPHN|nr:entericidin A/B family lipoprotein [Sphingomonas aliaeris]QQV76452.1 entericidin A/B family lipoprotein [Sphingomonas aliaeris]
MTKTITIATLAGLALAISACNTVNGAGKDMKSAGTAVSGASGKNDKK